MKTMNTMDDNNDRPVANAATKTGAPPPGAALLKIGDVARLLQMGERSVWRLRDGGGMPPPLRIGRALRWRRDEIEAWIGRGCPSCRPARLRR